MSEVYYQSVARGDLVDLWLYIAEDNVAAADAYIERLQHSFAFLAENPQMGSDRSDIAEGLKSFAIDNFVIYYQLHDRGITVLRVWHTARDPGSLNL